ncbi:enoyl-CoA hydratase/isomerase family protein, partial [Streptomyces sp. GSL17-113]
MSPTEPSVLVSTDGRAGRLVLNRPHALNALTREMVDRLTEALEAWERDP